MSIVDLQSLPVIVYAAGGARIALPHAADRPLGEWDVVALDETDVQFIRACVTGDYLNIICGGSDGLYLGQCYREQISDTAAWEWSKVADSGSWPSITVINGKLCVAYESDGLCFARASASFPKGARDWATHRLVKGCARDVTLAEAAGRPVVCYSDQTRVRFASAGRAVPRAAGDWRISTVYEDEAFSKEYDAAASSWQSPMEGAYWRRLAANPSVWSVIAAAALLLLVTSALTRRRRLRR